jgi:ABC-2 type transport system permease protein
MKPFWVVLRMDVTAQIRSLWFWLYTICVIGIIVSLFGAGITESRVMGFTGLTRLLLIFIEATNLILPIFILVTTVRTLVKERENNVFEYMLSFPVSLCDYYFGKVASRFFTVGLPLVLAMMCAAILGFASHTAVPIDVLALDLGLLLAATVFYVGVGFLISSLVKTQELGLGISLFIWIVLIGFLDVALLGFLMKGIASENVVYAIALLNPVQIFKIASFSLFDPVLSVIGPASYFILDLFGRSGFLLYAFGFLFAGGIIAMSVGFCIFRRRDLL